MKSLTKANYNLLNLKLSKAGNNHSLQKTVVEEDYHKSIRSNTSFAKSPTKTIKTQTNDFILSIVAYVKLEWLKQKIGKNHFALKAKIYYFAQQAAYNDLRRLSTTMAA